jgi:hypothetical protein
MQHRKIIVTVCGLLAVLASFATKAQSHAHEYVYCDNGIRCVRAPCPSRSAKDLQTGETLRGINLDLSTLTDEERKRSDLQDALYHGTLVLGGQKIFRPAADGRTVDILLVQRIVRASTKPERSHCSSSR